MNSESRRIRKYWEQVGGLLIENFQATPKKKTTQKLVIDGIIVLGEERRVQTGGGYDFTGKDIIIIQIEKAHVGMHLLGDAFFARETMILHQPKSIRMVAITHKPDEELYRLCREFDIELVVM